MATPIARVWLGDPAAGIRIGQTYDGSGDSISLLDSVVLTQGQYLTVEFSGGDPGETSSVSLYGVISGSFVR